MKTCTLKKLLPILKFSQKSSMPILRNGLVKNNDLYITDIDTSLVIRNIQLSDGLHDIKVISDIDSIIDFDPMEYPVFDFTMNSNTFEIAVNQLERIVKFTSKDETRPFLNGICWRDTKLIATNGYILRQLTTRYQNILASSILPSESLKILIKLCKKHKMSTVNISVCDDHFTVKNVCFYFKGRLINREYPNIKNIIPEKTVNDFTLTEKLNFKDFKSLLDKKNYKIELQTIDNNIVLKIPNYDYSRKIGFSLKQLDPMFFNAQQLSLILEGHINNSLRIEFNSNISPFKIESHNCIDIIMPIRS